MRGARAGREEWRSGPQHAVALSVVLPAYNEAGAVLATVDELHEVLDSLSEGGARVASEVIVVDDASTDATLETLIEAQAERPWLRVASLPTNRGQTMAFAAGLGLARGWAVAFMDADGQNDPRALPEMLQLLVGSDGLAQHGPGPTLGGSGADIVVGVRLRRAESATRARVSRAANVLAGIASGVALRDSGCSLKLMRTELARSMRFLPGDHRFFPALLSAHSPTPLRIVEVEVGDRARTSGESKYGYSRIPRVAIDLSGLALTRGTARRPLRGGALLAAGTSALHLAAWCATRRGIRGASGLSASANVITLLGAGAMAEAAMRSSAPSRELLCTEFHGPHQPPVPRFSEHE